MLGTAKLQVGVVCLSVALAGTVAGGTGEQAVKAVGALISVHEAVSKAAASRQAGRRRFDIVTDDGRTDGQTNRDIVLDGFVKKR